MEKVRITIEVKGKKYEAVAENVLISVANTDIPISRYIGEKMKSNAI